MSGMSRDEVLGWFEAHWPGFGRTLRLERLEPGRAALRFLVDDAHLRPGGTVSGPSMTLLADAAVYAALLAADREATDAVTSNLNISFLKRPTRADLLAEAGLLSLGRRLAVGEVRIRGADGEGEMVAHATVTYARP